MLKKLPVIALLLLALLATACQANPPISADSAAKEAVPTAEKKEVPLTAEKAVEKTTYTITDIQGRKVDVPVNPQRVVALSEQDMDAALTLGVPLVGVVNGRGSMAPPVYLQDKLKDVLSVGSFSEPSLETILTLKPDLIVIGGLFPKIEGLIPELSKIAPTVVTYKLEDNWKDAFKGTAMALNKEAEAVAWLTQYDQQVNTLKSKLGSKTASKISIIRWNPDGPVIMAVDAFSSLVIRDLGFTRPDSQQIEGYAHSDPISFEQLQQIDGDWIFISSLNPEGAAELTNAQANPIFKELGAVKQGSTRVVDGLVWTSRGGPLAALSVLADVEKTFQ